MHTPRIVQIAVVVAAVVIGLAACSGTTSPGGSFETESPVGALSWTTCQGAEAPAAPFQCATLEVPLNYEARDEGSIDIALLRYPAANDQKRAGVMLTNPGGPGASGFDFLEWSAPLLVESLDLSTFDIVGFDPRGVDRSGGLRCSTDAKRDKFQYVDDTPDTPEEKALFAEFEKDESDCADTLGQGIVHYSTENTARDMDLIRAAMKVDRIHFLGISYGTYLGGVYATLFPERVATMVLDSAFDPQGDTVEESLTTQAIGFEKAFNQWATWCQDTASCAFNAADVVERWEALHDRLDTVSLVSSDKRDINHRVMRTATISALYSRSSWGELASALVRAENGSGKNILQMADRFRDRNDDGTYKTSNDSRYIIYCASGFGTPVPEDAAALVAKLKKEAPWFSRGVTVEDYEEESCEKVFSQSTARDISYNGEGLIVVVGGEKEPATPMRWSEEMVENLGSRASLVRFSGEGHSQILVSRCVDLIAAALFTKGIAPPDSTTCDPDVPVKKPTWWDQSISGVDGVPLDADRMFAYFGIKTVDTFAQVIARKGDSGAIFSDVRSVLQANGFRWSK